MDHARRKARSSDEWSVDAMHWVLNRIDPDLTLERADPPCPDLMGRRASGARIAVEVTRITDPRFEQAMHAADAACVMRTKSERSWRVRGRLHTRVRSIAPRIDAALCGLESRGVETFEVCFDYDRSRGHRELGELGVESARQVAAWGGEIRFDFPLGEEHTEDPGAAVAAIEAEARREDNVAKLAAARADERHLAIQVGSVAAMTWSTLRDALVLPPLSTPLPSAIVLWAAAEMMPWDSVIWRFREGAWTRHQAPARYVPLSWKDRVLDWKRSS